MSLLSRARCTAAQDTGQGWDETAASPVARVGAVVVAVVVALGSAPLSSSSSSARQRDPG